MKRLFSTIVSGVMICASVVCLTGCDASPLRSPFDGSDDPSSGPSGGSDDPSEDAGGYRDKWAGLVNETPYELLLERQTARYGEHVYSVEGGIDYEFETQYYDPQVTASVTFTHIPSGYTEFQAVYEGLLGKSLQGVMAMVPMAMEIYARHPETGEKCFRLLCKDESVANGILRILKTKFPTSTKMETDPYCQRYLPAALLAGADYRNDYAPEEPYAVDCGAAATHPQETKYAPYGTVFYTYIFADGWESNARDVDVFLPLDGELYKIQGCAACYSQCRTILKGPWKGLK